MALLELIYTSCANAQNDTDDVRNILVSSEKNNMTLNVTGLLLFDGERYIQILEGEAADVDSLFEIISEDSRNHSLELLHRGSITGRSFETWRMAYESLPKGLLGGLAEKMAVYSMEMGQVTLNAGESFGAKLNAMFIDAVAAE